MFRLFLQEQWEVANSNGYLVSKAHLSELKGWHGLVIWKANMHGTPLFFYLMPC